MMSAELTPREREVLQLLCSGMDRNRDLAEQLVISTLTVQYHMKHIMAKLECSSRAQLVARAYAGGMVERDAAA